MALMKKLFQFQSLAARMNTILIGILVGLTIVIGFTAYKIASDQVASTAITELEAIASVQKIAIQLQLQNYLEFYNLVVTHLPAAFLQGTTLVSGSDEAKKSYLDVLSVLQRSTRPSQDLIRIDVTGMDQTILVSTAQEREGTRYKFPESSENGRLRQAISDLYLDNGRLVLDVFGPIIDKSGNTVAYVIIHFSGSKIMDIVGNYNGLGETGEAVLGARHGDLIYFLTPRRFQPDLSKADPISISGERAQPMIHATSGQSGVTTAPDYRQVLVVAAYRPISLTQWGLVVKQDQSEVYAGISDLQIGLLVSLGVVLLVGVFITIPLVKNFVRPLFELKSATLRIINGDYSARVPLYEMDEVGDLAASFNKMTAELQKTNQELIQRNEELTSFAYVVSHDLKAPLRGVHSISEWLEEDLETLLNPDQKTQFTLLKDRVNRMDALINGLLEYSRVGRLKGPTTRTNVAGLITEILQSLQIPEGFKITVSPEMPVLQTDALLLGRIFQNLIDNAIKYHPQPSGKIEISCKELDNFWEFSISDDGHGIEPRHQKLIFQLFQTLQTGTSKSTGIGLALVKKIIEDKGGEIRVESDGIPGKGTAFIFTWPKEIK